jgi:hypothetical protein
MTPNEIFETINWALLREQKLYLIGLDRSDYIDGVIALIDAMQDCAHEHKFASEKEIYG